MNLFENIKSSNSLRSNDRLEGRVEGMDVAGNVRYDKDHDYVADLLNQTICYDDFQAYLDC